MSTTNSLDTHSVGYKIKLVQHILRLKMDESLKSLGITTPQYSVLSQLELTPGVSNAELARSSFVKAQTMHGIISVLERDGLLKKKSDQHHGRIICMQLTAQGRHIVSKAHYLVKSVEEKMTQSMSKQNKAFLEDLLVECVENLDACR